MGQQHQKEEGLIGGCGVLCEKVAGHGDEKKHCRL